jgi:hypothetical protein
MKKKVVISCGPIPARLDSVKFLTNRFKGGLAFKTANFLKDEYDLTIVKWTHTELPNKYDWTNAQIVNVIDVIEYCKWFEEHAADYDAFIMAAAVANLMPSNPWEGKFPSHNYKVGDQFDIKFEIAPRAIDIIKKVNPRACLIGYKLFDGSYDELIEAARLTQKESKANIIFANTPQDAKDCKYAVLPDNSVIQCTFDEHLHLMGQQIDSQYYRTEIQPLTLDEQNDINIRNALAVVKMYERTFTNGFGTVAIPVKGTKMFATTSRGHKGEPVIVRSVDHDNYIIYASAKATLNVPALDRLISENYIVVHRHYDDPNYAHDAHAIDVPYCFPGTKDEANIMAGIWRNHPQFSQINIDYHGDMCRLEIAPPDWNWYHEQFPPKYFSTPKIMEDYIRKWRTEKTLEVGCNTTSDAPFAYDKYTVCENAKNLTWDELMSQRFDLIYLRNAINYLDRDHIFALIANCKHFIANTFIEAPAEKICDNEASVSDKNHVYHHLRLPDDRLIEHQFYAYTASDFEQMGLIVEPYSEKSCIVYKRS